MPVYMYQMARKKNKKKEEAKRKALLKQARRDRDRALYNVHRREVNSLTKGVEFVATDEQKRKYHKSKWQEFRRTMDLKEWLIDHIVEELDRADTEHQYANQFQMEFIDKIMDLHNTKMVTMHKQYIRFRSHLLRQRKITKLRLSKCEERTGIRFDSLAFDTQCEVTDNIKEYQADLNSRFEKEKKKGKADRDCFNKFTKYKTAQLAKVYQDTYSKYRKQTIRRRFAYRKLRAQDKKDDKIINRYEKKIQAIKDQIRSSKNAKKKFSSIIDVLNDLRLEREGFVDAYSTLRDNFKRDEEYDQKQLTILSNYSNQTLKELEKNKVRVDACLRVISLCKKLETEEEKILPFFDAPLIPELPKNYIVPISVCQDLQQVWLRHSNVKLHNDYMKGILQELKGETLELNMLLKKVLEDQPHLQSKKYGLMK